MGKTDTRHEGRQQPQDSCHQEEEGGEGEIVTAEPGGVTPRRRETQRDWIVIRCRPSWSRTISHGVCFLITTSEDGFTQLTLPSVPCWVLGSVRYLADFRQASCLATSLLGLTGVLTHSWMSKKKNLCRWTMGHTHQERWNWKWSSWPQKQSELSLRLPYKPGQAPLCTQGT